MTQPKIKDRIREVFDRTASTYDQPGLRFFSYFGKNLVAAAKIKPESGVLDVATGRGAVLFPAARAVGPSGCVVTIDLPSKMVEQTQLMLRQSSFRNITLTCMDAEDLQFPDNSFDYVLCGFSLFFFPALAKALSEFKRVLELGGYLLYPSGGTATNVGVG